MAPHCTDHFSSAFRRMIDSSDIRFMVIEQRNQPVIKIVRIYDFSGHL